MSNNIDDLVNKFSIFITSSIKGFICVTVGFLHETTSLDKHEHQYLPIHYLQSKIYKYDNLFSRKIYKHKILLVY